MMNKDKKNIYDYVENIYHILPRGKEEAILNAIIELFEHEEEPEEIVRYLQEEYGKTIDFEAVVQTLIVALDNIETLQAILNKYREEYDLLYVIGQTPPDEQCEWCRDNIEGKIFRLIDNPERELKDAMTDDPVFGPIPLIWPQKTFNPDNRWVRADFQHVNCQCSFCFFDPLINVYNRKTQQIEVIMDEEEGPEYMQKAYIYLLQKQALKEKQTLQEHLSSQERASHEKILQELQSNIQNYQQRVNHKKK